MMRPTHWPRRTLLLGARRLTERVERAGRLPAAVRTLVIVILSRPTAARRARTARGNESLTPNVPGRVILSTVAGILIVRAPIRALAVVVRRPALLTVTFTVAHPGWVADCVATAVGRGAAGTRGTAGNSGSRGVSAAGGVSPIGSPMAVPESSAVAGELASLLMMLRVAAFTPAEDGAKLTCTTQFAPTGTICPEQVSASTPN